MVKETYTYQAGAWAKTDETRFLYDGWNMITELDANGQAKNSYVWGLDLSGTLQGAGGIGGLLASVNASTSTANHYFHDANGNVGQLVDAATGATTAHYEYDPFGNVVYSHGPQAASNPYRFSDKYFDVETGLSYYGYRYYSAGLGRWVNRDPIEERGGINIYAAFVNDPVNSTDALGLSAAPPCCGRTRKADSGYEPMLAGIIFLPLLAWPQALNQIGMLLVKSQKAKATLMAISLGYLAWFIYGFADIRYFHPDPQGPIAMLFIWMNALPILIIAWIIVVVIECFHRRLGKRIVRSTAVQERIGGERVA